MEKVVIYIRVSTQEQAEEGYSVGEQTSRLQGYCKAMGYTIVDTFTDPGYSGGDLERPGLKRLIRTVESGGVNRVVVYKLDRLSRSQKDTLFLIEDVFLKNNTEFESMSEKFDTSSPFGRAMIGILAVFAQLEREQIKERMSMGREARAKEGKWHGGAREPIGYDYDPEADLLRVNEYEAMQVREAAELVLSGVPVRRVEEMFIEKGYTHKQGRPWQPQVIRRVLKSKVNCGYIYHKGEYYKGDHEPILDEETVDRLIEFFDRRSADFAKRGIVQGKNTSYLGGLLFCKKCGAKMAKDQQQHRNRAGEQTKPKTLLYNCYSRSRRVRKMIKSETKCMNKRWVMEELDDLVFNEIKKLALDHDYVRRIASDSKDSDDGSNKVAVLEKEIAKIDEQISRFMDLYGIGKFTIEQLSSKTDPLNTRRRALEGEIEDLNAETGRISADEAIEILSTCNEVMEAGEFHEIRAMIEALISHIEVDDDVVDIHWRFA